MLLTLEHSNLLLSKMNFHNILSYTLAHIEYSVGVYLLTAALLLLVLPSFSLYMSVKDFFLIKKLSFSN